MPRQLTIAQLKRRPWKRLTPSQRSRLRSHWAKKGWKTRRRRARKRRPRKPRPIAVLEKLPFKKLTEQEKRNLRSYRSRKGWETRRRRQRRVRRKFRTALHVMEDLSNALDWDLYEYQERILESSGESYAPRVVAEAMDGIDYLGALRPLKNVLVLGRYEIKGYEINYWTCLSFAERGDIAWSQGIAGVLGTIQEYEAQTISGISLQRRVDNAT